MKNHKFESCLLACSASAIASLRCASADLKESDVQLLARCIKLNNECAAFCLSTLEALARESESIKQICKLCAEICTACAVECEKHLHMDHCKICAEACRACAVECTKMSKIL